MSKIDGYTTMQDVLHVLGISATKRSYTQTLTPPLERKTLRAIATENAMQVYTRAAGESATEYISRIDAIVDTMTIERD